MRYDYSMFLDDERYPADEFNPTICRNVRQATIIMNECGCPVFISFDHDLGDNEPTGYDLAKWMIEKDLDSAGQFIPDEFTFDIHSQNPVGSENIRKLLTNYLLNRK